MGRRSQGYRIRQATPGAICTVRFRIDGERRELSTGTRDRTEADREGRRLYAEELSGNRAEPGAGPAARKFKLTAELGARWLAQLSLRAATFDGYEDFVARWIDRIKRWDESGLASYVSERLKEARAKTIKTEASALRGLLAWLVTVHEIDAAPVIVIPEDAKGVPAKRRTRCRAPDLSVAEVRSFLSHLDDKAAKGWWVRPRCELLYETALRPATIDRISVPEHWEPGSKVLRISDEIDKEDFGREVPLNARAIAILERCAPEKGGVVFGEHKYYRYVRAAATASKLPKSKARIFTGQHLRSARGTHLLDAGASLTGVQFLMGHKYASTTALYIRASAKEAEKALAAAG